MKKIIIGLLAIITLPLFANAMKIEKDEIDEFTGNRTVITSWEHLGKNRCIHIRFRLQNNVQWLDFKLAYDDASGIDEGDELLVKSIDGNIGTFISGRHSLAGRGDGAVGMNGSGVWGVFATYKGDLSYFSNNIIRLIRVNYLNQTYSDFEVNEKDAKKIPELYQLFNITINGEKAAPEFQIIYQTKTKRSSKWEDANKEYRESLTEEEIATIRNEWESKTNADFDYRVVIKRKKSQDK